MEETANTAAATQTAFSQLGALTVHYGLALIGAIVLLVGGWMISDFISRWAYRGLSRIHGIDETLARFFEKVIHYGLLILVFVMVSWSIRRADDIDHCRSGRSRSCRGPGAAGNAAKYRRRHHASGATAFPGR